MSCEDKDIRSWVSDVGQIAGMNAAAVNELQLAVNAAKRTPRPPTPTDGQATQLMAILMDREGYDLLRPGHTDNGTATSGKQASYARVFDVLTKQGVLECTELQAVAGDATVPADVRAFAIQAKMYTAAMLQWDHPSARGKTSVVDLNTADEKTLVSELGVSKEQARQIAINRGREPFLTPDQALMRLSVPREIAARWHGRIRASHDAPAGWPAHLNSNAGAAVGDWLKTEKSNLMRGMFPDENALVEYLAETTDQLLSDPWSLTPTSEMVRLATFATDEERMSVLAYGADALLPREPVVPCSNEALAYGNLWHTMICPTKATSDHIQKWVAGRMRPEAATNGYGATVRSKLEAVSKRSARQERNIDREEQKLRSKVACYLTNRALIALGDAKASSRRRRHASVPEDCHLDATVLQHERDTLNQRKQRDALGVLAATQPMHPDAYLDPDLQLPQVMPENVSRYKRAATLVDHRLFPQGTMPSCVVAEQGRANINPETKQVTLIKSSSTGQDQIMHEYLHWAEQMNPALNASGIDYLQSRTDDEVYESYALSGARELNEYVFLGGFSRLYTGRFYQESEMSEKIVASEIHTIGMEMLMQDAIGFAKEDPHYFDYMMSVLHNEGGKYTHPDWNK